MWPEFLACLGIRKGLSLYASETLLPKFTKADVDYLVAAPKFIKEIPNRQFLNVSLQTGWIIRAQVFSKAESRPVKGLVVIGTAHQAPVGLPRPTPSSALEWYGQRIRGLNYELWHDNPDGTDVRGWHEHVWSPTETDHRVIPARPEPKDRTLLGVLKWGLKRWNIEVVREQRDLHENGN